MNTDLGKATINYLLLHKIALYFCLLAIPHFSDFQKIDAKKYIEN